MDEAGDSKAAASSSFARLCVVSRDGMGWLAVREG